MLVWTSGEAIAWYVCNYLPLFLPLVSLLYKKISIGKFSSSPSLSSPDNNN